MASLGNDLATIREQKGKSLDDIHSFTKIPPHILQAIEDGSLFTDMDENQTYVRSYVRSYGKALKIDDRFIVEALDLFEEGEYQGQLLERVNVQESRRISFTYDDSSDPAGNDETGVEGEPGQAEDTAGAKTGKTHTGKRGKSKETHKYPASKPTVSSVDWADMGRKFTPLENRSPVWVGVVIVLVVVAAALGFWVYQSGGTTALEPEPVSDTSRNITNPGIVPDSLQINLETADEADESPAGEAAVDDTPEPDEQDDPVTVQQLGSELNALPDTLYLTIYAAENRLEPVRVYTDMLPRFNPYWIEVGTAYRYPFTELIRIRGQYSRMRLLMNGHPIENFTNRFLTSVTPDSQYVEIRRSLFEGDEQWLQAPPDPSEYEFPAPTTIQERPTFPIAN